MKKYVVCLKHGKKYGPEYVNTLANMVQRNCTLDYEFVCYTEDPIGIDTSKVTIRPLPGKGLILTLDVSIPMGSSE